MAYLAIGLALLAVTAAVMYRRARRAGWQRDDNMPPELRGAVLLASEKNLCITRPLRTHGRLDQAVMMVGRVIAMVETKHRKTGAVYASDKVQISLYQLMFRRRSAGRLLDGLMRRRYADYGFLRLVTPTGVIYRRVSLYQDAELAGIHKRYWLLHEGEIHPQPAAHIGLCKACAHRPHCPAMTTEAA